MESDILRQHSLALSPWPPKFLQTPQAKILQNPPCTQTFVWLNTINIVYSDKSFFADSIWTDNFVIEDHFTQTLIQLF